MTYTARFWVSVSLVTLGEALRTQRGEFHPVAVIFLCAALLALILSFGKWPANLRSPTTELLLGGALAYNLISLTYNPPGVVLRISAEEFRSYIILIQLLCLSAAILYVEPRLRSLWFPTLMIGHALIALWVLRYSSTPIDVLIFQRDSATALLDGRNPFAITFPDPYIRNSGYYGEGVSVKGRLLFGFPYPPLSLLLVLPAHIAGDVRYAHIAAVLITAFLLYCAAQGPLSRLAAALFLFTPWIFYLEESGWTEAFGVLLLASMLTTRSSIALGLFLGFKQYTILALAAVWRAFGVRACLYASAVAVSVTLPFFLWNIDAFMHSAVWLQFRQPWRPDSLSIAIALNRLGWPRLPWLGFVAASVAAIFVIKHGDKHRAALARNIGLVFLLFFAFSKQAFYNYYFLVVGCLSCALVLSDSMTSDNGNATSEPKCRLPPPILSGPKSRRP